MNLAAPAHVHGTHDAVYVATSIAFALIGSFAALVSAVRIPSADGAARFRWITAAAISLGGGAIWSMHFIGMLGYHVGDRQIVYNLPLTALSLVIAIVASGVGLAVVGTNPRNRARLVFSGLLTGLGVGAMHYTGMAAMRVGSKVTYQPELVAASLAIAVMAALAAFWIAYRVRTMWHIVGASVVMAVAVCGMHYTGMAATRVAATDHPADVPGADPISLTFAVCVIAFTVLSMVIFAAFNSLNESQHNAAHQRRGQDRNGRHAAAQGPSTRTPQRPKAFAAEDPSTDYFAGRQ